MKKIICVIPARLASQRFPRKILAKLGNKTLLHHVWERASSCPQFSAVYCAIDDPQVAEHLDALNIPYVMTPPSCINGTMRLIASQPHSNLTGDVWVNWQADEPFITPTMIDDLLQGIDHGDIWTLKKEATQDEYHSPHIVKVVTDQSHKALYFSRSLIPFDRDGTKPTIYKHIGLYAYSSQALTQIATLSKSPLATAENLEQLAFLEHGLSIYAHTTAHETLGIDTPQDLLTASLTAAYALK